MKRISILLFVTLTALWACDIKPAEEPIANTGAANFTATFETPAGIPAYWETGDKLLVIDSKNNLHRFDMDAGADKTAGEFSGTLSEDSQVKYVAYAHDPNAIEFDAATEEFTMVVPSVYTAKTADALVKANSAAIGTLQGSEVSLQSVCGFIKFTLEPNGKTVEQGGKTYNLTDLKLITFKSNEEDKSFAGTVHARWPEGAATPEFLDVEDGSSSITFRTRMVTTPEGDIYYEAGDYYIPVVPQNFEDVTITVEDADGNEATAVEHRAIDVQTAAQSNLNAIQWPTVVLEVKLQCSSKAEEQTHAQLTTLPTNGLAVDRVNNATGEKFEGAFPKKTEYIFIENKDVTEDGLEYSLWTTGGVGRWTASVGSGQYAMADLCFCFYNANWSYQSQAWTAGYQNNVSWIKFPAYDGMLTKVEIQLYHSAATGAMSLSSEVEPETGIGDHSLYYTPKITGSNGSFGWVSFPVSDTERGKSYYFCMESGNTWRIRGWKLSYKSFD